MIARITFSGDNDIKKSQLDELEKYFGEEVDYERLKVDGANDRGYSSLSWRETFDKDVAEAEEGYKLVKESGYVRLKRKNSYLVDLEKFMSSFPNIDVSMKGLPKSLALSESTMMENLIKIADKVERTVEKFDKSVQFNQECNVHVPNLGLLAINQLAYATDYCTEELQALLDRGYRIIAACPQPNQRRPDYILGMYVASLNDNVHVEQFHGDGTEKGKSAT